MGLMYWQINDIWQAPTWSTIDYELKWKMAHYYVRHMYSPVYPLVTLNPYLANLTDEQARISLNIINEYLDDSHGQLICSIQTFETFSVRLSFVYDITYDLSIIQHITDLPYASIMQRAGCHTSSDCLMYCSYNDERKTILDQTLFFTPPKNYRLYQPNLKVERIEQRSPNDWSITITATRPALFVWLDHSAHISGYFSRNGFHLFTSSVIVEFHSWTTMTGLDVHVSSLFDVTEP